MILRWDHKDKLKSGKDAPAVDPFASSSKSTLTHGNTNAMSALETGKE
jgi:hypothetical protein